MTDFSSKSTQSLQELERRIPVVGDKALIDLVNGIQVSKDLIRYRKNRGFFGQLIDQLDGSNYQRQILLDGNIIAGQEALREWVLELTDSLRISQVALEVTQKSLLEAREAIRRQQQKLESQEKLLFKVSEEFYQLAKQMASQINQLESRVKKLEVRVAANEDLDRIVTAWAAEQTYNQLPWPLQVALLSREIFSGAVIIYELETGDDESFRERLINKILATCKDLPKKFFSLSDLLDYSSSQMRQSDRPLLAALLEVRSLGRQQLLNIPHLFALGTTLELATLAEQPSPPSPGQIASALCQTHISDLDRTTDAREFITNIVHETANQSLEILNKA